MSNIPVKTNSGSIGDGQIHMMHLSDKHDDPPHRHIFFELVYIQNGSAIHHLEGETAPLQAGDYFIIDPGTVHCYKDTRNFEIMNCLFLPEYIDRALADCPSLGSLLSNRVLHFGVPLDIRAADRVFHDDDGSVGRMIRTMVTEYADRQTGWMELLRCYLTQVLVSAVRACETAELARGSHNATAMVTAYLKANLRQPLSLEAISATIGYTPQYLSSLFRKDTGICIREFLQRLRVEEAADLLRNSNPNPGDLAAAVGYSDVRHFARIFRKYKGVSLRQYRRTCKTEP